MWLLLLAILYVAAFFLLTRPRTVPLVPDSNPDQDSSSSSFSSINNTAGDPQILHPTKYDVFISFRGEDVRLNFLSHLYLHLNNVKKLAVYKDDVDLPRGAEISPTLLRAIEMSDVYVVILSRNYASSKWCLEELEKIFQCVEQHDRKFVPVTYDMSFDDFYETLPSSAAARFFRSWGDKLLKVVGKIIPAGPAANHVSFSDFFNNLPSSTAPGNVGSWRGKLLEMIGLDYTLISWRAKLEEIVGRAGLDYMAISFRGEDVRLNFLSHLYLHLNNVKKLAVYKDDVDLPRGAEISPTLLRAIEMSDVYVVILSRNYASSKWCLEELEKIFQCVEQHDRKFVPVTYDMSFDDFYETLPSSAAARFFRSWGDKLLKVVGKIIPAGPGANHVSFSDFFNNLPSSTATGNVGSWRGKLLEMIGLDYTLISWRAKLEEIVGRAGLDYMAISSSSSSEIVSVSQYEASRALFGMESKVKDVQQLVFSNERENLTIGLWGMDGIGKTTLARAFAHLFSREFDSIRFLKFPDPFASGMSVPQFGSPQRRFFSYLLGDDHSTASAGGETLLDASLMLRRVGRVKALVVVEDVGDDVGNIVPLKDLFDGQYSDLFGPGSVVIMTGTNQQLLKSVCHVVYEVKGLNDLEAWRLFCLHAFRGEEDAPSVEYLELARRAVSYAGGNPLAITLLGAHLYDRDLKFWVGELGYLHHDDDPNSVVRNIGRRSYEGLSLAEKDLFLDLACFYPYWENKRLSSAGVLTKDGKWNLITNLVDKSLISIRADFITVSRVIRDLGRSIVNEKEEGIRMRTRLWKPEHVPLLFKKPKGALPIKGIVLTEEVFQGHTQPWRIWRSETCIQDDAFEEMEDLRFLVIPRSTCRFILPENGLKCLPNMLRVLEWYSFPSRCLPSQFSAENLVTLCLTYSKVEQLWEGDEPNNMDLGNLKTLHLKGSRSLRNLPDLSTAKRLESIDLSGCVSFEKLPSGIGDLSRLSELLLAGCKSLSCLPDTIHKLSNLETLRLSDCSKLSELPRLPSFLIELDARRCKSLRNMSLFDDTADSQFTLSVTKSALYRWCFGGCCRLDRGVCSTIVDKFTHPVRSPTFSALLVPAKWVAKPRDQGEQGSIMGSSYKSTATADLRREPYKLKSLLFCIVINRLPLHKLQRAKIKCVMDTNAQPENYSDSTIDDFFDEITSVPSWEPSGRYFELPEMGEDEDNLSNDHLLLWSEDRDTQMARSVEKEAKKKAAGAHCAKVRFHFHGEYDLEEDGLESSMLIKNCRVIPVYDDRRSKRVYTTTNSPPADQDSSAGGDPDHQILHPTKYDVFISFRGADVRDNFLSHLYRELNNVKKLVVYKDDVDLPRGSEISPSFLQAIERSDVYVAILSRSYANSKWCLEELQKIFECVEQHGRKFIPVTYDMSFADFYEALPSSPAAGRMGSWRDKLLKITDLAGLDYKVVRASTILDWSGEHQSKVEEVERLWRSKERGTWTIGVVGVPGIGKSTLAQAFVRRYDREFDSTCSLQFSDALITSLLSSSAQPPFGTLQSRFFANLLGDHHHGGGTAGETLNRYLMLKRLGRLKALVVVDGLGDKVDSICQLQDLFNGLYSDMFGPGSVVIVTGTNQQLLKSVCDTVYQVEGLTGEETMRLFCLYAFKGEDYGPANHYVALVHAIIPYTGGNPSAAARLGVHLYKRDTKFWEEELHYLREKEHGRLRGIHPEF
ncbi:unnamed protein product [Linum tenue]|uniref:TIR domain-containing protein n=1 Tax=Linum tenue TaxID=586396 RepID=A0AAV0IIJ0_9ROSI|nr:unnamed protein product [Linum tenue]